MPNRILKESICTSATINELTAQEEIAFYRLVVACDDYGRMDARPPILRARLFPLRLDCVSDTDIERWLGRLHDVGLIHRYVVGGQPFLQVVTWERHQQIRAKRSKFPAPDEGEPQPANICNQMLASDSTCPRNPIQSESNPTCMPPQAAEPVSITSPRNKDTKGYSHDFDAWWAAYPRKVGKAEAWQAYRQTLKANVGPPALLAAARHYAEYVQAARVEDRFILHGATFLNKRRFEDFANGLPASPAPATNGHNRHVLSQEEALNAYPEYARRGA